MAKPRMPKPTPSEVMKKYQDMAGLYSQRNAEFSVLRNTFDAQFVAQAAVTANGLGEFADKKKLVYNMINTAIRRFMDELSAPIRFIAGVRGGSKKQLELAGKRQKALQKTFQGEGMTLQIIKAAYDQGLLDKAIFHVRPNPNKEYLVDISMILPEAYFPVPKTDQWGGNDAVLLSWMKFDVDSINHNAFNPLGGNKEDLSLAERNRMIEFHNDEWFLRLDSNKPDVFEVEIRHNTGVLLFEEAHNIPIPGRQRGQGDADQSVGLNEYLNQLMSDQADVLAYLANPIVVIRGSRVGTQNLTWGPRAIWELERDGSAEILTWAGAPPTFEAQILRTMQGIEDNTGLSAPAFGREVPSGVSGETVRSILAGFNTRVGTKQTLMGLALAGLARKIQQVWETQFPNRKIPIAGGEDGDFLIPKEMEGFYDVTIIFEPQNETVRTFSEVQKMKEGLQSRRRTMLNLGVPNPEDEMRQIRKERMEDIRLTQMMTAAQGGGGVALGPNGQPIPGAPGPTPFGAPTGDPRQGGQPTNTALVPLVGEAIGQSDPGKLTDDLFGTDGEKGNRGDVEVRDVINLVGDLDLEKSAFLSGEIVKEGKVSGNFDLVAQTATDAQRIREALGDIASRANIILKDTVQKTENLLNVARSRTPRS